MKKAIHIGLEENCQSSPVSEYFSVFLEEIQKNIPKPAKTDKEMVYMCIFYILTFILMELTHVQYRYRPTYSVNVL